MREECLGRRKRESSSFEGWNLFSMCKDSERISGDGGRRKIGRW